MFHHHCDYEVIHSASSREEDEDDEDIAEIGRLMRQNLELRERVQSLETEIFYLRTKVSHQKGIMCQLQSTALLTLGGEHQAESCGEISKTMQVCFSVSGDPFVIAAEAGDLESVVRMIPGLQEDARITEILDASILVACQKGHIKVVEHLLICGCNVHVDHDSPLQWAAQRGDEELTKLLLRWHANPRVLNDCPLRLALHMGHKGVAKILIDESNHCRG